MARNRQPYFAALLLRSCSKGSQITTAQTDVRAALLLLIPLPPYVVRGDQGRACMHKSAPHQERKEQERKTRFTG